MPEDALECALLHRGGGPRDCVVVGVALGLVVVAARLPAGDRRAADGAGNQPHRDRGVVVSDGDPEGPPQADARHPLVEVNRVDRRSPPLLFGEREHPRVHDAVLILHDPATSHVRLSHQQEEVKPFLRRQVDGLRRFRPQPRTTADDEPHHQQQQPSRPAAPRPLPTSTAAHRHAPPPDQTPPGQHLPPRASRSLSSDLGSIPSDPPTSFVGARTEVPQFNFFPFWVYSHFPFGYIPNRLTYSVAPFY